VYFLHDKVKNIEFIADMVRKLVPGVRWAWATASWKAISWRK
jgi:transcription-repair coupling factor (superfamily II helicase)